MSNYETPVFSSLGMEKTQMQIGLRTLAQLHKPDKLSSIDEVYGYGERGMPGMYNYNWVAAVSFAVAAAAIVIVIVL